MLWEGNHVLLCGDYFKPFTNGVGLIHSVCSNSLMRTLSLKNHFSTKTTALTGRSLRWRLKHYRICSPDLVGSIYTGIAPRQW